MASWDLNKNDPIKKRRLLLKRFMQAGTKIILRLRAEKALDTMKNLLQGCGDRQDVKNMVLDSWNRAEMEGNGNKNNVQF